MRNGRGLGRCQVWHPIRRKCEKIAVVGGPKWVEWGSNLFGHFLKGEVRTFAGADLPAAWTWIKA